MAHYKRINKDFEPSVQDTVEHEGKTLVCSEAAYFSCEGCFLTGSSACKNIICNHIARRDSRSIILAVKD